MKNANRWTLAAIATILIAAPVSGRSGASQEGHEHRDELFAPTADQLEELAAWCQSARLYAERDRLYEALLRLQPEHPAALRYLQYRRGADGAWRQSSSYRRPRNRGKDAADLTELAAREGAIVAEWHATVDLLADAEGMEHRERMALVLLVDHDNAEARAVRGESWSQPLEQWMLTASLGTMQRGNELRAGAAQLLRKEPEMEDAPPGLDEASIPLRWQESLATARLKIRATCKRADEFATYAEASWELFGLAFGEVPLMGDETTIYVLGCQDDRRSFVQSQGLAGSPVGALDSFWVPASSKLAITEGSHAKRVDHLVRHSFQRMLQKTWAIDASEGWVHEGMGVYLSELLTGRHGVVMQPMREKTAVLGEGKEIWKKAAGLVAARKVALAELLPKPAKDLTRDDVLVAYALCRFLVEGHPGVAATVLDRTGQGEPPEEVFQDALGLDVPTLQAHLERWVAEVEG